MGEGQAADEERKKKLKGRPAPKAEQRTVRPVSAAGNDVHFASDCG